MAAVEVSKNSGVTTVRINRPHVMNAVDGATHDALEIAFNAFEADDTQRVCVVTGTGDRAFCAGSDLQAGLNEGATPYPPHGYAGLIERFDLSKPLIAAVNGVALGGGFEIALACDIIVASETATFGLPEPMVGAVALGGGLHRLSRQIGLKRAMGMILATRKIDAREAFTLGLVNEVVAPAELEAATRRWCDDILRGAPLAIRASKQAVMRGLDEMSLADALRNQANYPAFSKWRTSDETKEGPRAFVEKRRPVWSQ